VSEVAARRLTLREHRDQTEAAYITATLNECDGCVTDAAKLLGIERTNLHKRIKRLGIATLRLAVGEPEQVGGAT
jgi:two-component system nitrogen regulation response regulator NtrX